MCVNVITVIFFVLHVECCMHADHSHAIVV